MDFINDFIEQYGATLMYAILTSVISYIGIQIKQIIKKYTENEIQKDVVKRVCKAIEQQHKNLNGEEKLQLAIINTKNILENHGIRIDDFGLRIFIESTVNCFERKEESI